jgi:hypothetical protein
MAWTGGTSGTTSTDWQDFLSDLLTLAEANGWTRDRYATGVIDANNDDWIAHGSGGGSDAIYVGIRTFYDSSADVYNLELAGLTGYDSGGAWDEQPGISPGRFDGASAALQYGCYLPGSSGTITWWASATSRRIYGVLKIGTAYYSFYLGWINPYATSGEYNYPLLVAGSMSQFDFAAGQTHYGISSIVDPQRITASGAANGPMMLRLPGGSWRPIQNASLNVAGSTRTAIHTDVCWPAGRPIINTTTLPDEADRWFNNTFDFDEVIPQQNVPGAQTAKLYKTDDSGGDLVKLFPATVVVKPDANESLLAGELDGVFWVSASAGQTDGGLSAEDTITVGGDTYHVFPGGSKTGEWNYFALKEA